MQKILFPYTKDTFCGSLDTEPVSCICIADPNLVGNRNRLKIETPKPKQSVFEKPNFGRNRITRPKQLFLPKCHYFCRNDDVSAKTIISAAVYKQKRVCRKSIFWPKKTVSAELRLFRPDKSFLPNYRKQFLQNKVFLPNYWPNN